MITKNSIINLAQQVGFDICGVAPVQNLQADVEFLKRWIGSGYGSTLHYLARNLDLRADATKLLNGAKSVIVCGMAYKNIVSGVYDPNCKTKVASYACMEDYHTTIKNMLFCLAKQIKEIEPNIKFRATVDSAPIFEKKYAVSAGLGWIGKQSLLVNPKFGTYLLLGELIVSEEFDSYDSPISGECGSCNRCATACPNGAVCGGHINTSKCISRATIECQDQTNIDLHGWIFGCEECQICCPYNKNVPISARQLLFDPLKMEASDWLNMSKEEFEARFAQTPLSRSGIDRIKENVSINDSSCNQSFSGEY